MPTIAHFYKYYIDKIIVILTLITLSFYHYQHTIQQFPSHIHSWSQSDRYAIALGFLDNKFDLFHPISYNLKTTYPPKISPTIEQGITSVDCPINEWIIAIIMKVTNKKTPAIFRAYILAYSLIGLFFLYLLSQRITQSFLKSFFIVLFAFNAPVFTYYQAGFIPSIPAIANLFIAAYFLILYYEKKFTKYFYISIFFLTLSALNRTPFVIPLFALFCMEFIYYYQHKKLNKTHLFTYLFSFTIIVMYYLYNSYLNSLYGSLFLRNLMPAESIKESYELIKITIANWKDDYFTYFHYYFLIISVVLSIYLILKKYPILTKNHYYFTLLFINFIGAIFYYFLMQRQFPNHDYYYLDTFFHLVIFALILLLTPISIKQALSQFTFVLLTFPFIFFFTHKNLLNQKERYFDNQNDIYFNAICNFNKSNLFLDSLNIPKDAKILILNAYSPNANLIQMNRKGYAFLSNTQQEIKQFLQLNYDYVLIENASILPDIVSEYPAIINHLNPIATNNKITVYNYHKIPTNKTLLEFLQTSPNTVLFSDTLTIQNSTKNPYWKTTNNISNNSIQSYYLNDKVEFGTTCTFIIPDSIKYNNSNVLFSLDIFAEKAQNKTMVVLSIQDSNKIVHYQTIPLKKYLYNEKLNRWHTEYFTFNLPQKINSNQVLNLYLWNPDFETILYKNPAVLIYKK